MSARSRTHPASILLAALALAFAAGVAETQEPAARDTFAERISVTEVQVPVQVLVDGRPVRGLTRENFEIYDRGVLQEIRGFEVVDLVMPALAPPEAVPRREGSERAPLVPPPPPEVRGRQFLLLFDFDFSRRHLLARALLGAEALVERQSHPADRIGVAIYGPATGVSLISGFTTDRRQTRHALAFVDATLDADTKRARAELAALGELLAASGGGEPFDPRSLATLADQLGASAALAVSSAPDLLFRTRTPFAGVTVDAGQLDQTLVASEGAVDTTLDRLTGFDDLALEPIVSRIRAFGRAMAEFATLLRNLPEPKYVVYLSEGFPTGLLERDDTRARVLNRIEPLIEAFRGSGWAIHSIDIEGVPVDRTRGVEISPEDHTQIAFTYTAGADPGEPPPTEPVGFDAVALHYLAAETGGQLFENYGNLGKATERLLERTSVTYVLSFEPADLVVDGRFRPIDVRLKDGPAKARIVHRPGYSAPKPLAKRSKLERRLDAAELVLGGAEIADFPAAVVAVPFPSAGRGGPGVPFFVEIRGSELPLVGDRRELELEIHAYAVDGAGVVQDLMVQALKLDLDRVGDRLARGGLRFVGRLDPGPGAHELRVLAREPRTGATHLSTLAVTVGSASPDSIQVLPPVFFGRPDGWIVLGVSAGGGAEALTRLVLGAEGTMLSARPALARDAEQPVLIRAYSGEEGAPGFSFRILRASGERVDGGELARLARVADGADGAKRFVAVFRPTGLAAGRYRLELAVGDGERESVASSPFEVVAN